MLLDNSVERLRSNAEVVAALAANVSDEQSRWRPNPDHWSIVEVLNHLADEEDEDFRVYIDCTLHRPDDDWPSIDPRAWVTERNYQEQDLSDSLARFLRNRADSIAWLRGLEAPDWSRAHARPGREPLSAGDLLLSWVSHDFIHIRQLNRLHREFFVSSSQYSPQYAGSW